MKKLLLLVSLLLLGNTHITYAHDVIINANTVTLTAQESRVQFFAETGIGYEEWALGESGSMAGFKKVIGEDFQFKNKDNSCELTINDVINNAERGGMTDVIGILTCTEKVESVEDIEISSVLFQYISDVPVDTYIRLQLDQKETNIILTQENPTFLGSIGSDDTQEGKPTLEQSGKPDTHTAVVGVLDGIRSFILIGIEHILFGTDHVLFLIALILVVTSYRQILILISGFTLGHSVTLILAGLGVLQISSQIVEPIIALSIVLVAGYNLYILYSHKEKKIDIRTRLGVTLGFGLFHGLGFAGSLADTVIPREFLFSSLVAFNVGVELGQIMIIAIAAPAILYLLKSKNQKARYILLLVALLLTLISLYWFIERTFL